MIIAAYYTHHNTEIFFLLTFIAVVAWALMIFRLRLRYRRTQELPYGIRPITVHESKLDQWPIPESYDDIMSQVAKRDQELRDQFMTEMIIGRPRPLVDAWKLIEPDFQTESV